MLQLVGAVPNNEQRLKIDKDIKRMVDEEGAPLNNAMAHHYPGFAQNYTPWQKPEKEEE